MKLRVAQSKSTRIIPQIHPHRDTQTQVYNSAQGVSAAYLKTDQPKQTCKVSQQRKQDDGRTRKREWSGSHESLLPEI